MVHWDMPHDVHALKDQSQVHFWIFDFVAISRRSCSIPFAPRVSDDPDEDMRATASEGSPNQKRTKNGSKRDISE